MQWAFENRPGRIIPVLKESCDPTRLHLRLGTIQHIDFNKDRDAAAKELVDCIARKPRRALEFMELTLVRAIAASRTPTRTESRLSSAIKRAS